MKAKLIKKNLNGKTYNYIDYGNESSNEFRPSTSVDGWIVEITNESREKLTTVGGFYRELLTPLIEDENMSITQLIILSVTSTSMSQLVGYFFDDGSQDMQVSWTKEPKIATYYEKLLKDRNISYLKVNTLDFLSNQKNKESKYFEILDLYYNPISADDTGIHMNGQIIQYGQTVIINDIPKMIEKHEHLKESNLNLMDISKIELKIYRDGPKLMGTIGEGLLFRKDGSVISSIEDYYYSYAHGESELEEFLEEYYLDSLHEYAIEANKKINKNPEDKEKIINETIKDYELEKEEDNNPLQEMIGFNFLLSCIEENLVEIKKTQKELL